MRYLLFISLFLFMCQGAIAQELPKDGCFEIKYLDFFGLDKIEMLKWPESELKGLMDTDLSKYGTKSSQSTNFMIPLIVSQLRNYHPNCVSYIDTSYFNQLVSIYCAVRQVNKELITHESIAVQIDFMRYDFYNQVNNDTLLPYMSYTLDDGPFYGIDYVALGPLESIKTVLTDFGSLVISKKESKNILTCLDNKGRRVWQKVMTSHSERYLRDLQFTENAMERNSLATVVHMMAEGERLTLYLKNDGRFMYYFHSW